ncbi:hypothetical protein TVAG_425900 [Trichomonas vaginalis G3]|uniref:Uncharacterized protein n=1 Tax=Trichomonas vaginalis (strain ATCC PRA-98 / G3) TaxID=412133 RepID=A2FGX9_TRIV3|nr:hypothetical protein TVAGG3_1056220 [Trichomonas vaginalis G3]EAX95838.1 hypothetical protein TVAG_425900 [Trichomonas vaginalis G3]KAI5494465.1 hypothetical protein TVAGG3_1056220 [Trichomonas vaginalis G3]|eukprot:XP_001308768.1 hypothetical protein [Trichomonas vaginalis G3]
MNESDFTFIPKHTYIVSSVVLAILYIMQLVYSYTLPKYFPDMKSDVFLQSSDNMSAYMIVLTVNPQNHSRVNESYQYWGEDYDKLFKKSIIRYVSPLDLPFDHSTQFIAYWNNSISPIQNLLFTYLQALQDFYYGTDLDWAIRTTEDCFVDIRHIGQMLDDITRYLDPRKEQILKGQLVRSNILVEGTNFQFLHGGSGWLVSRATAKYILDHQEDLIQDLFTGDSSKGDDVITFNLIKRLKLLPTEVQSYRFLGVTLTDTSTEFLRRSFFRTVSNCKYSSDPLQYTIPFDNVVFWHSGRPDNLPNADGYRILSNTPKSIRVQMKGLNADICFHDTDSSHRSRLQM